MLEYVEENKEVKKIELENREPDVDLLLQSEEPMKIDTRIARDFYKASSKIPFLTVQRMLRSDFSDLAEEDEQPKGYLRFKYGKAENVLLKNGIALNGQGIEGLLCDIAEFLGSDETTVKGRIEINRALYDIEKNKGVFVKSCAKLPETKVLEMLKGDYARSKVEPHDVFKKYFVMANYLEAKHDIKLDKSGVSGLIHDIVDKLGSEEIKLDQYKELYGSLEVLRELGELRNNRNPMIKIREDSVNLQSKYNAGSTYHQYGKQLKVKDTKHTPVIL